MEMAHFPIVTGLTLIGFDELDRFYQEEASNDSPAEAPIPIVTGFPLIGFDELDRFYEEEASSDVKTPIPSPAPSDCTVTLSPSSSSPSAIVPGVDKPFEFDGETALGIVFFYMRAKRIHAETKTRVAENNLKEATD